MENFLYSDASAKISLFWNYVIKSYKESCV